MAGKSIELNQELFSDCKKSLDKLYFSNNLLKNIEFFNFADILSKKRDHNKMCELSFADNLLSNVSFFGFPRKVPLENSIMVDTELKLDTEDIELKFRVDFRNKFYLLDAFQLLFLKIDNKKELKYYSYFHKGFKHFKKHTEYLNQLKEENQEEFFKSTNSEIYFHENSIECREVNSSQPS